jgi:predicted DNA-binding protein (UPF0251 family)
MVQEATVDKYATRRGERHPRAKLTEDDVRLIRALGAEGMTQRGLAAKFEVSKHAIEAILTRQSWRHV